MKEDFMMPVNRELPGNIELPPYRIDGKYETEHQLLFQTPLFQIKIDDVDNDELIKNAYELQSVDEGKQASNNGGWHSDYYGMKDDNIRYFTPLIEKFGDILPVLPFNPSITELHKLDIWYNISKKYNFNSIHNHPRCDLSGVYYVKVPKGDCGDIAFRDPRPSVAYGNPFIVERYHGGDLVGRKPEVGNMYIFPSSLDHSVKPNMTDDDRISISFNLTVN